MLTVEMLNDQHFGTRLGINHLAYVGVKGGHLVHVKVLLFVSMHIYLFLGF